MASRLKLTGNRLPDRLAPVERTAPFALSAGKPSAVADAEDAPGRESWHISGAVTLTWRAGARRGAKRSVALDVLNFALPETPEVPVSRTAVARAAGAGAKRI